MAQPTLLHHDKATFRSGPGMVNADWAPFYHGVASGDPLEDRVIIWTRVTPSEMNNTPIDVAWRVATDPALTNVVQTGMFTTTAARDYTVKVDVTGLQPGQTYYYGFTALGRHSLTGRTKTTPVGNQANHLKFGVVSCSNYQAGYFNAYKRLSERNDLDAIIHLGDYIYEYADRVYGDSTLFDQRTLHPENEIITLAEYRTRYSTYRLDTALVRAHQQHPFIAVWDDHESANDAYTDGAQNHNPATEGSWEARKAVSKQVYFEWMPIRDTDRQSVYRLIRYGQLLDLVMLDTRLEGREQQINSITDPALQDTARTILGREQREWLLQQLSNSQARWKAIGQQVIMADLNVGWAALANPAFTFEGLESLFLDIWDGYPAERRAILNHIRQNQIDNVVILSGDFHSAFAFDLPNNPVNLSFQTVPGFGNLPVYTPTSTYNSQTGEGSIAVEFVTPSVTSANFDENVGLVAALGFQLQINSPIQPVPGINLGNPNPHMKFKDLIQHGYFILDVTPQRAQADWFFGAINSVTNNENFAGAWFTEHQANRLRQASSPSAPKAVQDLPAPLNPPGLPSQTTRQPAQRSNFALLSVWPNPVQDTAHVHYSLTQKARVRAALHSAKGGQVMRLMDTELQPGIYTLIADMTQLPAGYYFCRFMVEGKVYTAQVVKQ